MDIHLTNNGQQLGAFSRDQVEAMVRSGTISYDTLAWVEGYSEWRPLSQVIGTPVPPAIRNEHRAISTEMHPIAAYFVPVGRVGGVTWFVRNLAHLIGISFLATPFSHSESSGAELWFGMLALLWIYLTIVNAGKRFHDLNVTAWISPIVFIPVVPLFLLCLSGTKGTNKYGPQTTNKSLR